MVYAITGISAEDAGRGPIITAAATTWQKMSGAYIIRREDPPDMGYEISAKDRTILNMLQNDFPVSERPYRDMAERLNIDEAELIERISLMKESGVIRRIGAIIESRAVGYHSTLCACRVEPSRADDVASRINRQPGVTHNYLRDQEYNLWFTLTTESEQKTREVIAELESQTGLPILSMPTEKVYKIKVALDMGEKYAI